MTQSSYTMRAAKASDWPRLQTISKGIYGGLDYLHHVFELWYDAKNYEPHCGLKTGSKGK